ncbi:MAG: site-specific DNA-methyltransferase, partial [Prevotella sp.]|nr:site-specific DNA-methyltransferase [Prevotella sp.]
MKNKVYNIDSRKISKVLSDDIKIQTTITSPPYFDMKDYGVDGQVGYGQKYDDYLLDLRNIFGQVFQYTKKDGTLWIIIDTFKRNHTIVPLPFDLASKLQQIGW